MVNLLDPKKEIDLFAPGVDAIMILEGFGDSLDPKY